MKKIYRENYYDIISPSYDELYQQEQLKKIAIIKQHLASKLNAKTTILDIGCGPYYADWQGIVIGLDPSKELLKQAAQKGIKTIVGVAEQLPFKDRSFDYVISVTAAQNFTDVDKAFSEIKRTSKKAVITFLKGTQKEEEIINGLKKHFSITNIIDQGKDWIYFVDC
ncbi:methyltransferase domain-containing protein [Candidatus Woesearchaeota archaeon]|nr:methyltransferase domain-containing protein [Candidatus Woesearchaeota archaeon]